jgi:Coenzyme PQQ synthesis protein D (PqqD)
VRLKGDIEWQDFDGRVVALDLASSGYMSVNEAGTALWVKVASGATEPELVDELVTRYRLDDSQARADVRAFLDALRAHDLVEDSARGT